MGLHTGPIFLRLNLVFGIIICQPHPYQSCSDVTLLQQVILITLVIVAYVKYRRHSLHSMQL